MRNRWLAKGAEAGQRDKVYGIGPHSGSKAQVTEAEMNTYMAFLIDLTKAGVQAAAVPLGLRLRRSILSAGGVGLV